MTPEQLVILVGTTVSGLVFLMILAATLPRKRYCDRFQCDQFAVQTVREDEWCDPGFVKTLQKQFCKGHAPDYDRAVITDVHDDLLAIYDKIYLKNGKRVKEGTVNGRPCPEDFDKRFEEQPPKKEVSNKISNPKKSMSRISRIGLSAGAIYLFFRLIPRFIELIDKLIAKI